MSVVNAIPLLLGGEGYEISRSVRLRSSASAYFNRTPASSTNRTTWTWSGWVKFGSLSAYGHLFAAYQGSSPSDTNYFRLFVPGPTNNQMYVGGGVTNWLITTQVFRDPSAWYHVVLAVDTTQATASNRLKLYINGLQVTSFSTASYPAQNATLAVNANWAHAIGVEGALTANYFDGYITEVNFIDGQALTPSSFGEFDAVTGVWKPKKYAGTYGTNGFYLPFKDNTISVLSDTATVTAPFGGTATNARVTDGVYVTSNTSTGSSFTFVQYDFGSAVWLTRFYITNLYFTGGISTFQVQYGNDPTWTTFTVAGSLSVTGSAQTFSGSIMGSARYVRLLPTAFGTNGQANVDAFVIYQDGLGNDYSGNGNNWTPNNISVTAGVTYDSMLDVPTLYADGGNGRGNYAVMNPLHQAGTATPSFGNLRVTQATNNAQVASTFGMTTGKWYYEHTITAVGGEQSVGIGLAPVNGWVVGNTTGQYGYYSNGNKILQGTQSAYGASYTTGDVIGVAYDADAGSLTFYKNGTSQGVATTGLSGTFFALAATRTAGGTNISDFNFGQRPFAYTPPTGFKALNTQNLPEPTIKKGNQYFDATTYTGTGSALTVTNSGSMQPDLVWIKSRSNVTNHNLTDAVRGVDKLLFSNATAAEATFSGGLSSFNSGGFSLASGGDVGFSASGYTYVGWQWKESPSAGFDIVTYSGTGAAQTVAHNLGVAPRFIIAKGRNAAVNWFVGSGALPSWSYALEGLNTTAAANSGATAVWNATAPTSSVFSVGTDLSASGGTYVAYLFAEVAGFSKFGSYTGNGSSTDGPFVFCGFRPRYVMIKRTDSTGDWFVFDTARNTFNTMSSFLRPNWSDAEATNTNHSIDMLSNGFKSRAIDAAVNASGGTFIYAAFAENPFKNSLAR